MNKWTDTTEGDRTVTPREVNISANNADSRASYLSSKPQAEKVDNYPKVITNERRHSKKAVVILGTLALFALLASIAGTLYLLLWKGSVLISDGTSHVGENNQVVMGAVHTLEVDVVISVATGSDSISGKANMLFEMHAYLMSSENSQITDKVSARIHNGEITVSAANSPVTLSGITANIDLNGLSCEIWDFLCVDISPTDGAGWIWDTVSKITACSAVDECLSQITPSNIQPRGYDGDVITVMGIVNNIILDITIDTDYGTAEISDNLDTLMTIVAFLSPDMIGSRQLARHDIPLGHGLVFISPENSFIIQSLLIRDWNLDGMSCVDTPFLCTGISPANGAGWFWNNDGRGQTEVGCTKIDFCRNQINSTEIQVGALEPTGFDITMGSYDPIMVNVTLQTGLNTAIIQDDPNDLFLCEYYFKDSDPGQTFSPRENTSTLPYQTVEVKPNALTTFTFKVIYDLSNMSCSSFVYICVRIYPSESSNWFYSEGSIYSGCCLVEHCDYQINGIVSVESMPGPVTMGMNLPISAIITMNLGWPTGMFSGETTSLFDFHVYLAADERGNVSYTEASATAIAPSNVGVCAECVIDDIEIHTLTGYDLYNVGCHQYPYLCVAVSSADYDTWRWDNDSNKTACTYVPDCIAVIDIISHSISPTTHDVIMGVVHTYSKGTANFTTGNSFTGRLSGNMMDLFDFIYTAYDIDSGSATMGKAVFDNTFIEFGPGETVTFTSIEVTMDLSNSLCEIEDLFCYEIRPKGNSNWAWYGDVTAVWPSCGPFTSCRNTYRYGTAVWGKLSWDDAAAACAAIGMHLPMFPNQHELDNYSRLLWRLNVPEETWIGANDKANDGDWVFEDGSAVLPYAWHTGEPNNAYGVEHCAVMKLSMTWNDIVCSYEKYYFCQRAMPCTPDFTCDNGKCILERFECDFYDDCDDATDEIHCDCYPNYHCGNGICVDADKFCDGKVDCDNGSDESDCKYIPVSDCYPGFQCDNGQCIVATWRCDQYDDCPSAEDEDGCPCSGFKCLDDDTCVNLFWICDGAADCGDGSDELDCANICPGMLCAAGNCIPSSWVCDNFNDCGDNSDELNCCEYDSVIKLDIISGLNL